MLQMSKEVGRSYQEINTNVPSKLLSGEKIDKYIACNIIIFKLNINKYGNENNTKKPIGYYII